MRANPTRTTNICMANWVKTMNYALVNICKRLIYYIFHLACYNCFGSDATAQQFHITCSNLLLTLVSMYLGRQL